MLNCSYQKNDEITFDAPPLFAPQAPQCKVVATKDIETLIQKKQVAALEQCQPSQPDEVAALCFRWAETRPAEVEALFWNDAVATAGMNLLAGLDTDLPDEQTLAIARCLLETGHNLQAMNRPWPACVHRMLAHRRRERDEYWKFEKVKHITNPSSDPLKAFPLWPGPFYSINHAKVTLDMGKSWGEYGGEAVCRHFEETSKGDAKVFLNQIIHFDLPKTQPLIEKLKNKGMEGSLPTTMPERPECNVHFTPDQFGELLVRIASGLQLGDSRVFRTGFFISKGDFVGHSTRVFLKKDKHSLGLKVYFHDLNVGGDMKHLRVLPEDLKALSFHDFDTLGSVKKRQADVLSMQVNDAALARTLAGQFVQGDTDVQISSLLHALASGISHEVTAAAAALHNKDLSGLNGRSTELNAAMFLALDNDHADALLALARSSLPSRLERNAVKALLIASYRGTLRPELMSVKETNQLFSQLLGLIENQLTNGCIDEFPMSERHGEPGLYAAMKNGNIKVIAALAELIEKVKGVLGEDSQFIEEFLQAKHRDEPALFTALQQGNAETIQAFGGLLQPFMHKLPSPALTNLLAARDGREIPGFNLAMRHGHDSAVTAFAGLLKMVETKLHGMELERILQGESGGITALKEALMDDRAACILAFGRILQSLRLAPSTLVTLLSAKSVRFGIHEGSSVPTGLQWAIEFGRVAAIEAYSQMVIELQADKPKSLQGKWASELLQFMRSAHGKRVAFFLWINTSSYKYFVKQNPELYKIFKDAKRSLGA